MSRIQVRLGITLIDESSDSPDNTSSESSEDASSESSKNHALINETIFTVFIIKPNR